MVHTRYRNRPAISARPDFSVGHLGSHALHVVHRHAFGRFHLELARVGPGALQHLQRFQGTRRAGKHGGADAGAPWQQVTARSQRPFSWFKIEIGNMQCLSQRQCPSVCLFELAAANLKADFFSSL